MRKFGEIHVPYRGENIHGSISCSVCKIFFPVFAALGVIELYLIANFDLIIVEFGATVTISSLVQISDTKPRRVRRRVALWSSVVKNDVVYQYANFLTRAFLVTPKASVNIKA